MRHPPAPASVVVAGLGDGPHGLYPLLSPWRLVAFLELGFALGVRIESGRGFGELSMHGRIGLREAARRLDQTGIRLRGGGSRDHQNPCGGQAGASMSTSIAPKMLMLARCAGEMCASTSSSMRWPARRICSTASPVILRRPGNDGVRGQGQAPVLLGLGLEMPGGSCFRGRKAGRGGERAGVPAPNTAVSGNHW